MDLSSAESLARQLMAEHRLSDWRFAFDRSRRRFGVCRWNSRTIGLSRPLTELNGEAQVRDTILHELAHALAGRAAGHGPAWRAMAQAIGARPRRCYEDHVVATPALPYRYKCPICGHSKQVARRSRARRSCGRCARTFDPRFLLRLEPNPAYAAQRAQTA